jgi:hypothetical protein
MLPADQSNPVLPRAESFSRVRTKGLSNGEVRDESEALRAEIEKLEKIIGRQTIAIEALKKTQELISGKR